VDNFKANTGDTWVAEEMMAKVGGHNVWLWNVMDAKSRYLLAAHISKTRTIWDAQTLLRKAKRRALHPPKRIITDGLKAHQDGIERIFGADTLHTVSEGIRSEINNNLPERLQGTVRERTKVIQGMKTERTAALVMDGFRLHHNHVKPQHGIEGKTPAELVDLPFVFQDWVEVAHLRDRTLEDQGQRQRLTDTRLRDRTFRNRGRI
jgi:transposase-like protein